MKIQSDTNKTFGRRKGKKLSNLQIENSENAYRQFFNFSKKIDGTFKLQK